MTKKRKPDMDMSDLGFDEALARLIQTAPEEVADEAARLKREQEEVKAYVEERRDSIERGARRSSRRFRL